MNRTGLSISRIAFSFKENYACSSDSEVSASIVSATVGVSSAATGAVVLAPRLRRVFFLVEVVSLLAKKFSLKSTNQLKQYQHHHQDGNPF